MCPVSIKSLTFGIFTQGQLKEEIAEKDQMINKLEQKVENLVSERNQMINKLENLDRRFEVRISKK